MNAKFTEPARRDVGRKLTVPIPLSDTSEMFRKSV